jgi:ubiquitin fusion degradation protein 1
MDFKSLKAFPLINKLFGDKIILPPSILDILVELDIQYPMTFEIISKHFKTNCGVIEFTANEGECFIPEWIMKNLDITQGEYIYIRNVSLSTATFIKFKPDLKFLELFNPRAVLEYNLRSFSCVTIGDKIHIIHNFKEYILEVIDVKPKKGCCIIDSDIIDKEMIISKSNFL